MQQAAQVKQAIGIADTLIEQYHDLVKRIVSAAAERNGEEFSANRAHLERVYTSIWEQLDTAANLTRSAGRSVGHYDRIREQNETNEAAVLNHTSELINVEKTRRATHYTFRETVHHNGRGRELAVKAADLLRGAWPEISWAPDISANVDLRPRGLGGFIARLFGK